MTRLATLLATATLYLSGAGLAAATDLYPWRNHAAPFNFLFGNEIDATNRPDRRTTGICSILLSGSPASSEGPLRCGDTCPNATSDCTVWLDTK
jgi:hypothetical protein